MKANPEEYHLLVDEKKGNSQIKIGNKKQLGVKITMN